MEYNFCEYLINIGLINKESFSNLIFNYHKKSPNENIIDNMKDLLLNFLNNLSEEDKKIISNNLVEKYVRKLLDKKIEKLRIIFFILKEKLSLIKLKYLLKWKLISFPLDRSAENTTIQSYEKIYNTKIYRNYRNRNMSEGLYNFMTMKLNNDKNRLFVQSKKKKIKNMTLSQNESTLRKCDSTKETINPYRKTTKKINEQPTSAYLKEQEELKECTFSPKINNYSKIRRNIYNKDRKRKMSKTKNNLEVFIKLHNDDIIYKNKIKYSKEKYEKKFREKNTFHPRINNDSFSKKLAKNNITFEERQKQYLEKKEKNAEKIKQELDNDFSKLCSFIPEVNNTTNTLQNKTQGKNESNTEIKNSDIIMDYYTSRTGAPSISHSPFMRLYEESKNRNLRKIKREKEYRKYLNNMANISYKNEIKDVNYEKLNELYLYDKKYEIIKKTKQKVENEEGSTFKPNIYINNTSKNIMSDFYERNEKFIKDKQNFIEKSIKEREILFNNNIEMKRIDKFSREEKDEIIKNIVKRLSNEYAY